MKGFCHKRPLSKVVQSLHQKLLEQFHQQKRYRWGNEPHVDESRTCTDSVDATVTSQHFIDFQLFWQVLVTEQSMMLLLGFFLIERRFFARAVNSSLLYLFEWWLDFSEQGDTRCAKPSMLYSYFLRHLYSSRLKVKHVQTLAFLGALALFCSILWLLLVQTHNSKCLWVSVDKIWPNFA